MQKMVALSIFGVFLLMALIPFFNSSRSWINSDFAKPWDSSRPAIYATLINSNGDIEDLELPDEQKVSSEFDIKFAPGMMDGVMGGPSDNSVVAAAPVYGLIKRVLKSPKPANIVALYDTLDDENALAIVDELMGLIANDPNIDAERLRTFFRWLAQNAPDREPVKASVAILGMFEGDDDHEIFMTLGRHDEFALYATVALMNSSPNAEMAVWALAKNVRGWGRIQAVERLKDTNNTEIKSWLVRDGFHNSIMNEYLAYLAATTGSLREQLASKPIDDKLLDGAAGVFIALIGGGPAEDITDYKDAPESYRLFIEGVRSHGANLERLQAIASVWRYLSSDDGDHPPWPAHEARQAQTESELILNSLENERLVATALKSTENSDFWTARIIADIKGIDTWEASFQRHQSTDDEQWYFLMQTDDPSRIDRVISMAEKTLPLEDISTGPALLNGLGEEFADHSAVDFIVQDLKRFPGKGWPIVHAALKSPVIRNRNMALNALEAWGEDNWPNGTKEILVEARNAEPDEAVRKRFEELLSAK